MGWKQAWLQARETADPALLLAEISHPTMETLRLVKDPADIVSNGQTYKASWFDMSLDQDDGNVVGASFQFPNVKPDLGQRLMRIVDPLEVTLKVISAAHPDEPARVARRLQLKTANIMPGIISGQLNGIDYTAEPCGTKNYVPSRFPASFRGRF